MLHTQYIPAGWPQCLVSPLSLSSRHPGVNEVRISTQSHYNSKPIGGASGYTATGVYKGALQMTTLYLYRASRGQWAHAALRCLRHFNADGCHQCRHSIIRSRAHSTPAALQWLWFRRCTALRCQVTSRCFENAKSFRGHFLRLKTSFSSATSSLYLSFSLTHRRSLLTDLLSANVAFIQTNVLQGC